MSNAIPSDLAAARIVNAAGTLTRLSGARVSPAVAAAMAEAATQSFDMWQLQAAASARIATVTGAEAGLVTTGAAAGLTLAAAAVIAGLDPARMDRLPDTTGLPNEIIVPRTHRNAYDRALRVAGAKLVDVGVADRETGAGIRGLEAWEVEAAITPRTVAIAASASASTIRDIPILVEVARRRSLKLIVDAAGQLPPVENLRRPIEMGASLVVYSGGKAIGGPQASGILAGERALIGSAALQMLDMDVRPDAFVAPDALFKGLSITALPRHGIGRGFKASKEAIVGLLVALDAFVSDYSSAATARVGNRLDEIASHLRVPGVTSTKVVDRPGVLPRLAIAIDASVTRTDANEVAARLKSARPAVHVVESRIGDGILIIDLIAVAEEQDQTLAAAIVEALR